LGGTGYPGKPIKAGIRNSDIADIRLNRAKWKIRRLRRRRAGPLRANAWNDFEFRVPYSCWGSISSFRAKFQ